ncbi:unnamed protein product [Prorocentrum cordatum]|uniref:Uncharacterized protein n=1 Tax=Prorocentrum cordatum TaxID=2364126 RepID=A0ABN9VEE6_9DINO|nr:unnamed protein product [Polarella glacialis]
MLDDACGEPPSAHRSGCARLPCLAGKQLNIPFWLGLVVPVIRKRRARIEKSELVRSSSSPFHPRSCRDEDEAMRYRSPSPSLSPGLGERSRSGGGSMLGRSGGTDSISLVDYSSIDSDSIASMVTSCITVALQIRSFMATLGEELNHQIAESQSSVMKEVQSYKAHWDARMAPFETSLESLSGSANSGGDIFVGSGGVSSGQGQPDPWAAFGARDRTVELATAVRNLTKDVQDLKVSNSASGIR